LGQKGLFSDRLLDALSTLLTLLFDDLNLLRVNSFVPESSPPEMQAFERLGFILEGRLRDHVFRNGTYRDLLILALLREDFIRQRL
jgi:RimJ/RimL family protein N-acetyltransferase